MSRVDLHMHSDASDGSVSVEILIARAALSGLTSIAVTEHDNVDSWETAHKTAKRNGIQVTTGIEISTRYDEQDLHLLGYDFSPSARAILDLIEHQSHLRRKRFGLMLKKLMELGIKLPPGDIHTEKTGAPGRVHIAQAMVTAGVVPSVEMAFERFLRKGRPAYIPYETISPVEAIGVVHESGGFVSLAHPVFSENGGQLIEELVGEGLDAIEVLHPKHTPSLQDSLVRFCEKYRLLTTGGSDWHGTLGETYDLGEWYLQANGRKNASTRTAISQLLLDAEPVRPSKRKRISQKSR